MFYGQIISATEILNRLKCTTMMLVHTRVVQLSIETFLPPPSCLIDRRLASCKFPANALSTWALSPLRMLHRFTPPIREMKLRYMMLNAHVTDSLLCDFRYGTGSYATLSSICFLLSGVFADVLLVRWSLVFAYSFLIITILLGFPDIYT